MREVLPPSLLILANHSSSPFSFTRVSPIRGSFLVFDACLVFFVFVVFFFFVVMVGSSLSPDSSFSSSSVKSSLPSSSSSSTGMVSCLRLGCVCVCGLR